MTCSKLKPPAIDLPDRRPVWDAVSELYLDTELTPDSWKRIADVLRDSPYSQSQLDEIMFHEVYPALISNLWSVAGEWSGFDLDALQASILKRCAQRWRLPLFLMPGRYLVRESWRSVKRLL